LKEYFDQTRTGTGMPPRVIGMSYLVQLPHSIDAVPTLATILTNDPDGFVYGKDGCAVYLKNVKLTRKGDAYVCEYKII